MIQNQHIEKKIENLLRKNLNNENIDATKLRISIRHNKPVADISYTVSCGSILTHSDITECVNIVENYIKEKKPKVSVLSTKKKEAKRGITITRKLKRSRFVTVSPAIAFH